MFTYFSAFSHEGTDSGPDLGDIIVVISSFKSKILEVQVCEAGALAVLFLILRIIFFALNGLILFYN